MERSIIDELLDRAGHHASQAGYHFDYDALSELRQRLHRVLNDLDPLMPEERRSQVLTVAEHNTRTLTQSMIRHSQGPTLSADTLDMALSLDGLCPLYPFC